MAQNDSLGKRLFVNIGTAITAAAFVIIVGMILVSIIWHLANWLF